MSSSSPQAETYLVCFNNPSEDIGIGHHQVVFTVEFQFSA